jgi:hypothetical protein
VLHGILGGDHQTVDTATTNPHSVTVQIFRDNFKLSIHNLWIKMWTPIKTHNTPNIVADTFTLHHGALLILGLRHAQDNFGVGKCFFSCSVPGNPPANAARYRLEA